MTDGRSYADDGEDDSVRRDELGVIGCLKRGDSLPRRGVDGPSGGTAEKVADTIFDCEPAHQTVARVDCGSRTWISVP